MLKWQLMLKCDKVCPAISTCHHDSIRNSNGCNEKNNGKTEGKRKGCSGDEAVGGQEGRKTEGRKTENAGCYYLSSTKWMDGNCIGDKNNVWLQSEECGRLFLLWEKALHQYARYIGDDCTIVCTGSGRERRRSSDRQWPIESGAAQARTHTQERPQWRARKRTRTYVRAGPIKWPSSQKK